MRRVLQRITASAVILVGTAACGNGEGNEQARNREPNQPTQVAKLKQACEVFTLEMARQLLGEGATQSEISAPFAGSSEHIEGSTCTYEAAAPKSERGFSPVMTATVMLKGAKTSLGKRSNQATFQQTRATYEEAGTSTEPIGGMEETAFYTGGVINQLHVLVNDGEYELIASAMKPDGDQRAITETLGRWVMEKL